MPRQHPEKPAALAAIKQHLTDFGPVEWKRVHAQFPHVHEQTVWEWIREVRKAPGLDMPQLNTAKAKLKARAREVRMDHPEKGEELPQHAKHLPAAPSPSYIARTGLQGERKIDFLAEMNSIYADILLLRAHGVKTETNPETGEEVEKIKNPIVFDRAIARRIDVLMMGLNAVKEIWDLRKQQELYGIIIDAIGEVAPEVQKRILEKLAQVNAENGITMAFKV